MSTALLAAHQVSKGFGDFTAVDAVSLTLHAGEIHAFWAKTALANRPW